MACEDGTKGFALKYKRDIDVKINMKLMITDKNLALFIFCTALFLSYPCFAITTAELVKSELSQVTWIQVNEIHSVKLKPNDWQGPADLSFKYRTKVKDGKIFIWVEVADNQVIFKDAASIASDHVELWLADPRLTEEQKDRITILQNKNGKVSVQKAKLEVDRGNFISYFPDLGKLLRLYTKNKYYSQFIFNNSKLLTGEPRYKTDQIYYEYQLRPGGYQFFAIVPLAGSFDIKTPKLENIAFLIDVVDVDDTKVNKQKNLISSSIHRQYGKPDTFNKMKIYPAFNVPIDNELVWKIALTKNSYVGDGYLKVAGKTYIPLVEKEEPFAAGNGAENFMYPGSYAPLQLKDLSQNNNISIYCNNENLVLVKGTSFQHVNLSGHTSGVGNYKCDLLDQSYKKGIYYFLINLKAETHWPLEWHCSGQGETSLLWIAFNESTNKITANADIYNSCGNGLTPEVDDDFTVPKKVNGNIFINSIGYQNNKDITFEYSSASPEKGVSVTEESIDEQ